MILKLDFMDPGTERSFLDKQELILDRGYVGKIDEIWDTIVFHYWYC